MANSPRPILVVSISVAPGTPGVFKLLEAGAVDVLPKPTAFEGNDEQLAAELIAKVRIVAGVRVFRRPAAAGAGQPGAGSRAPRGVARLVVIGASTGGPEALRQILGALPAAFPLPLACIQHIGREFLPEMLAWLGETTPLSLSLARGGEAPEAGRAYFAPADRHLEFDPGGRIVLSQSPPRDGHRPSVTVAMEAAAQHFGAGAVGVLLTGMGRDGAAGLASIARAGGTTIVQDEATSVIFGMPGEAVSLGAAQQVLPLDQIAPTLVTLAGSGAPPLPRPE